MSRTINWFALASGLIICALLAISLFIPWWQLTVGEELIKVNVSPIYTNFGVLGLQFTVPILWALNIVSTLMYVTVAVTMLVYALFPSKSYSMELLAFSYRKPLYALIIFIIGLIVALTVSGLFGFAVPFIGSKNLSLPSQLLPASGLSVNVLVSSAFQLPFYLAITAAALSLIARLYHKRALDNYNDGSAVLVLK